ncbi:hypothetical protein [Deinococcus hohokamensis]|uniref:Outer membrane protein beta-barrel domain-containing protein n=1 Tax=Deinococcus hohokamensis TaxID=309883 RepID=A0ABV9I4Z6_9DEIO
MRILKNFLTSVALTALSCGSVAQTAAPTPASTPAPVLPSLNGPTLWGGLSSELLFIPTIFAGFSVPVSTGGDVQVSLRGTVETAVISTALGAEVLLSRGPRGLYGGPSAAVMVGETPGWMAGGVIGYRNQERERIGFFLEGKLRYLVLKDAVYSHAPPAPGQPTPDPHDFTFPSPGLRFGLTYRF